MDRKKSNSIQEIRFELRRHQVLTAPSMICRGGPACPPVIPAKAGIQEVIVTTEGPVPKESEVEADLKRRARRRHWSQMMMGFAIMEPRAHITQIYPLPEEEEESPGSNPDGIIVDDSASKDV